MINENKKETCFYTGLLMFALFLTLLNLMKAHVSATKGLTLIDELFSVLVKLRLHLVNVDLANLIGLQRSYYISCYTNGWILCTAPKTPDWVARHWHFAAKLTVFSEAESKVHNWLFLKFLLKGQSLLLLIASFVDTGHPTLTLELSPNPPSPPSSANWNDHSPRLMKCWEY